MLKKMAIPLRRLTRLTLWGCTRITRAGVFEILHEAQGMEEMSLDALAHSVSCSRRRDDHIQLTPRLSPGTARPLQMSCLAAIAHIVTVLPATSQDISPSASDFRRPSAIPTRDAEPDVLVLDPLRRPYIHPSRWDRTPHFSTRFRPSQTIIHPQLIHRHIHSHCLSHPSQEPGRAVYQCEQPDYSLRMWGLERLWVEDITCQRSGTLGSHARRLCRARQNHADVGASGDGQSGLRGY